MSTEKPSYDYARDLFQNRAKEIQKVRDLVYRQRAARGEADERAVIFTGVRGVGKTWFSLHLSRDVFADDPETVPFLISLIPINIAGERKPWEWWPEPGRKLEPAQKPCGFICEIMQQLARRLTVTIDHSADANEQARQLAYGVSKLSSVRVVVLIIDSAFESPFEAMEELQRYLLKPLLHAGWVVAVITGRGRTPPWESPFLRQAELPKIEPLPRQDALNLIRAGSGVHIKREEELIKYSARYPLMLRLLAESTEPDFKRAIEQAYAEILNIVENERDRKEINDYVRRASALEESYRDDAMLVLMTEENQPPPPMSRVRALRNLLQEYSLVDWKVEESGYQLNDSICMRDFLKDMAPDEWDKYRTRIYTHYKRQEEENKNDEEARAYYKKQKDKYATAGMEKGDKQP